MGKAARHKASQARAAANRATTVATRPAIPGNGSRSFLGSMGFGGIGVGGGAGNVLAPYHAVAPHDPNIPRVSAIGPRALVQYQPMLRWLQRHYHRNDGLFQRIIAKDAMNVVGTGPVPTSRFERLNDLWQSSFWPYVDANGVRGGGDWLREDVYKTQLLDGETFIRRSFDPSPFDPMGGLIRSATRIPLSCEVHHADQFPWWQTMANAADGSGTVASVEFAAGGRRRTAYWGYPSYPGDYPNNVSSMLLTRFPASEMLHVFSPGMTNSPRGECIFAPSILIGIRTSRFVEADFTRVDMAARFCGYIKETVQTTGESQLAGERVYDDLMNLLAMDPGQLFRLPPGMDIQFATPPQPTPGGVDMLKFMLSLMCAPVGLPVYELDMSFADLSDRVMVQNNISYAQQTDIRRSQLRSQVMSPLWRWFVDACLVLGLWAPERPDDLWAAYQDSWRWPLAKQTKLTQELPALIQARDAGFISTDAVSQSYFGTSVRDVARDEARYQADLRALGFSPSPTPAPVDPQAEEPEANPKKDAKPKPDEAVEAPAPAAPASTSAPC